MAQCWRSFSLRTLLVALTCISVAFAWFFHYRGTKVREQNRIRERLAEHKTYVNFRYHLLGWKVPLESRWLCSIAVPEPDEIGLRPEEGKPLPKELCEIARRCPTVVYEGSSGGDDAYLRECVSERTQKLVLSRNGLSTDCLVCVGNCPNLREVKVGFIDLTTKSLEALLSHPRIESMEIYAEEQDLSNLGELQGPNALQQLELNLSRDWRRTSHVAQTAFSAPSSSLLTRIPAPGEERPSAFRARYDTGNYLWMKQCTKLREITIHTIDDDTGFFEAACEHLKGVEKLVIERRDPALIDSLGGWQRLRHLHFDGVTISDEDLSRIVARCPGLHTLEIDNFSESGPHLSPTGLQCLQDLAGLRRLRLGGCPLSTEHMAAIAKMPRLEELSFEDPRITDRTVEPLAELPNLKRISLERTKASGSGLKAARGDWNDNRPYWSTN